MVKKTFQIITLVSWTVFLIWLLSIGQKQLAKLLHPNLWWLLSGAVVVLLLYILSQYKRENTPKSQQTSLLQIPAHLILLLPILFYIPVKTSQLDSASFEKRSLIANDQILPLKTAPELTAPDSSVEQTENDTSLTQLNFNFKKYEGKEVEVICRTYLSNRLPEKRIMCYRFMISCCAADARTVFILLQPPDNMTFEHDKWIKAKGILGSFPYAGHHIPSLAAETIEYVEEPLFPYAY